MVVVSDEDDFSPLTELEYYDFFLSVKEEELFFFHSVVSLGFGCGTDEGDRYVFQSNLTGVVPIAAVVGFIVRGTGFGASFVGEEDAAPTGASSPSGARTVSPYRLA